MTQPDPIQAQLIAARRTQILDAATKIFAEKGFHKATIKDVAKEAGIADGTIYNYFDNKTGLLLGILNRMNETEQRAEHLEGMTPANIQEWMSNYIKHRYEKIQPEALQIVLSEVLTNKELRDLYSQQVIQPTYALTEKFFERWEVDQTIKAVDPALAMRVIAGAALGVLILRLIGDPQLEAQWDDVPAVLTEIILNGIVRRDNDE